MLGVRAMVLEVDTNQRRLSLGLKASYFSDAGDAVEDDVQVRFDHWFTGCCCFLKHFVISNKHSYCNCSQSNLQKILSMKSCVMSGKNNLRKDKGQRFNTC